MSDASLPGGRYVCCACGAEGARDGIRCDACGDLVDRVPEAPAERGAALRALLDGRAAGRGPLDRSGVWRYRELVAPGFDAASVVSLEEGRTPLYESAALGRFAGLDRPLLLKHEGMNPTGSFKDRGMTVGVSVACMAGARAVACASTGNTSASLAAYAARAGLPALVLVPEGRLALGKLAQSIAYGARVLQVAGGFDEALRVVEDACRRLDVALLNSVNPWRIEGQKAIGLELLQDLGWEPPDWIALPAGNLGNTAALGKALAEAAAGGLIARAPRVLAVQAAGAAPFHRLLAAAGLAASARRKGRGGAFGAEPVSAGPAQAGVGESGAERGGAHAGVGEAGAEGGSADAAAANGPAAEPSVECARSSDSLAGEPALIPEPHPETIATAIRIGDPRSWRKALRALRQTGGLTDAVSDAEILEAKAAVDAAGLGCEPASAAAVAGVRRQVAAGMIPPDARVACILTGHLLKDPDAVIAYHQGTEGARRNPPRPLPTDPAALEAALHAAISP